MSPKERQTELAAQVREALGRQEPIAQSAVELVKLLVEEAKESLVSATGDDMLRIQGAAQRLQKLYRQLTINPPTARPKE